MFFNNKLVKFYTVNIQKKRYRPYRNGEITPLPPFQKKKTNETSEPKLSRSIYLLFDSLTGIDTVQVQ